MKKFDKKIPQLRGLSGFWGYATVKLPGTADGWLYTISNNLHLVNQAGEDIDSGVPVKESLVTEGEDGSRDYAGFYDLERIRNYINERG